MFRSFKTFGKRYAEIRGESLVTQINKKFLRNRGTFLLPVFGLLVVKSLLHHLGESEHVLTQVRISARIKLPSNY